MGRPEYVASAPAEELLPLVRAATVLRPEQRRALHDRLVQRFAPTEAALAR